MLHLILFHSYCNLRIHKNIILPLLVLLILIICFHYRPFLILSNLSFLVKYFVLNLLLYILCMFLCLPPYLEHMVVLLLLVYNLHSLLCVSVFLLCRFHHHSIFLQVLFPQVLFFSLLLFHLLLLYICFVLVILQYMVRLLLHQLTSLYLMPFLVLSCQLFLLLRHMLLLLLMLILLFPFLFLFLLLLLLIFQIVLHKLLSLIHIS